MENNNGIDLLDGDNFNFKDTLAGRPHWPVDLHHFARLTLTSNLYLSYDL
jgi:hypothetical protein